MPESRRRGIALTPQELLAERPALARELTLLRLERGLTQYDLAALIGCRQSDISEYENSRKVPRPARLARILAVLR